MISLVNVIEISFNEENYFISFLYIATKALSVTFFSLEDVYSKIILSYDSISPYAYLTDL